MGASRGPQFVFLLFALTLLARCATKEVPPPPAPPVAEVESPEPSPVSIDETKIAALEQELQAVSEERDALAQELETATDARDELAAQLGVRDAELTALEESKASIELELGIALEELIRSRANIKNVQSRAFAVSRIAEVRVALEGFRGVKDPALNDRLERAESFLARADQTLDEDNWGGAAFLAERAGELVRQAKTFAELRKREPSGLLPIVPPRTMHTRARANLRSGPGTDEKRLGTVASGIELEAIGRLGEWFQVALSEGGKAWIHRSLVE